MISCDDIVLNEYISDLIDVDDLSVVSQSNGVGATFPLDETDTSHVHNHTREAQVPRSDETVSSSYISHMSKEISQSTSLPYLDHLLGSSRSRREPRLPAKFNDYIIEGKHKYGIKHYVNYSLLNTETRCFVSNMNKIVEPKNYFEASTDPNWRKAMNDEKEALYRNNT